MAVKLDEQKINDFNSILFTEIDKLEKVREYFSSKEVKTLKPQIVRDEIAAFLGEKEATQFIRIMITILQIERESGAFDLEKFIDSFEIEKEDELLSRRKKIIKEILSSERISAVAKAAFLSYESENIFYSMSSIIDIRPIFNVGKTNIVGNVIMPTLRVSYYSSAQGESRTITLCADENDLSKIADALSEMVQKIKAIKTAQTQFDSELCLVAGEARI